MVNHLSKYLDLYGNQAELVNLGSMENTEFSSVNSMVWRLKFGQRIFSECGDPEKVLLRTFSIHTSANKNNRFYIAPPESARAVIIPDISDYDDGSILIKGCGLISRFAQGNRLRSEDRIFNGELELSEACYDFVYSQLLSKFGVLVADPVAVIDLNRIVNFGDFEERACLYVRLFRSSTRLSNLFYLTDQQVAHLLGQVRYQIGITYGLGRPLSFAEYVIYITHRLATAAAVYQDIGYTQDSLHYGQLTLAGELCDFGIGHFNIPENLFISNTVHPWFRFSRQPILFQNLIMRTHALKSEPDPVPLCKYSVTYSDQKYSLLEALRRVCPNADDIFRSLNIEKLFWGTFNAIRQENCKRGIREVAHHLLEAGLNWEPCEYSASKKMIRNYKERCEEISRAYAKQRGPWGVRKLTSQQKQIIWGKVCNAPLPIHDEEVGYVRVTSDSPTNYIDSLSDQVTYLPPKARILLQRRLIDFSNKNGSILEKLWRSVG